MADLALCYLDFFKLKLKSVDEQLDRDKLAALSKISHELSDLVCGNREQLLEYGGGYSDGGEVDYCRLLDMLILSECVMFSLLTHDVVCYNEEFAEPPDSINLAEELLVKFDNLVITEKLHADNQ